MSNGINLLEMVILLYSNYRNFSLKEKSHFRVRSCNSLLESSFPCICLSAHPLRDSSAHRLFTHAISPVTHSRAIRSRAISFVHASRRNAKNHDCTTARSFTTREEYDRTKRIGLYIRITLHLSSRAKFRNRMR